VSSGAVSSQTVGRKPYAEPKLTEYGPMTDLTRGGVGSASEMGKGGGAANKKAGG
jgi:hypothetical protein